MEIGGGPAPEPVEELVQESVLDPVLDIAQVEETYQTPVEEAIAQDPVAEVEMQASNIQASLEQELTDHFETFDVPDEVPTEEPMPIVDEPVASIEEDLGAAFASEFEQIASQQLEEGVAVPETEGWTETETEDANAAFTAEIGRAHV